MRLIFCLSFLLGNLQNLKAEKFNATWDSIKGVKFYEYEVHKTAQSSNDSLLYSGRLEKPNFEKDVTPGVYFLRVRGIDSEGKPGDWSPLLKYIVKGNSPEVINPKPGADVDPGIPVSLEWQETEGATDYRVILMNSEINKKLDRVVTTPSTSIKALPIGEWKLQVFARQNSQTVAKSKVSTFKIKALDLNSASAQPVILEPLNGQRLKDDKKISIVWHRRLPGTQSEVIIQKKGGKIVKQQMVESGNEYTMKENLPKGTYQIIVRNYLDLSKTFSQDQITVGIGEDPQGEREGDIRMRIYGGFVKGSYMQSNYYFKETYSSSSNFLTGGLDFLFGIGKRTALEVQLNLDKLRYEKANLDDDPNQERWNSHGGLSYKASIFDVPLDLKLMGSAKQFIHMIERSPNNKIGKSVVFEKSITFSLTLGGELTLFSKDKLDVPIELLLSFPVLDDRSEIGGGVPQPTPIPIRPAAFLNTYFRYKLSTNLRGLIILEGRYDHIDIEEPGDPKPQHTRVDCLGAGIKLGIEFGSPL